MMDLLSTLEVSKSYRWQAKIIYLVFNEGRWSSLYEIQLDFLFFFRRIWIYMMRKMNGIVQNLNLFFFSKRVYARFEWF